MAIKLIFEDKESTPSSVLLKKSEYGEHIYFSGGSANLWSTVLKEKGSDDIVYVFLDVSPNNKRTVRLYQQLIQDIKQNASLYLDIHVIPIICIEYYICIMFLRYNYFCSSLPVINTLIDALVKDFDYALVPQKIKTDTYLGSSLEHLYKHIVANQKMRCLRNTFLYESDGVTRKKGDISGKFYESSCNCSRKYCSLDCKDDIRTKAKRLCSVVPLFARKEEECLKLTTFSMVEVNDNNALFDNCQKLYDTITTSMGLNPFVVVR